MPASERAVAHVDTRAVEANCRTLARLLESAELCAVVKSDGYGHGAVPCARAALAGGAAWLAVATAREAEELRAAGIDARILVMGALTRAEAAAATAADADVVCWTEAFLGWMPDGARVHVKLDTGMGRLGTKDVSEALRLVEEVERGRTELAGVMTHFATADERGDRHFPDQLAAFEAFVGEVRAARPGVVVHAANSAGTYRDRAAHFDLVRCGIAVYGLDPFHQDAAERDLRPALSLESWVAAVRRFEPGDSAGYGRRWQAEGPRWVATVPIGYGDGWRRGLTNNADVLIRGRRHPLVGTVSMDNITVDLGPETDAEVGDQVVLIGAQGEERISCEEVARRLDTINYEVTCGLTARVPRRHG